MNRSYFRTVSWLLIVIYLVLNLLRSLAPNLLPQALATPLISLMPLAFIFVHGSLNYRFRDLLAFLAITLLVTYSFENMSVLTGFPFGHYDYSDTLGPKLFLVPVLIGLGYAGTGYIAWTLAHVISGAKKSQLSGHLVFTVPVFAAFMMVSWDLTIDPIYSTIYRAWIWPDGGSYFGVPFSNFLGWLLTTFVYFQLFALYLKWCSNAQVMDEQPSRTDSLQAIMFYTAIATRPILNSLVGNMSGTVTDSAGVVWRLQDIYAVTGLIAIFTMGTFTILGLVKLMELSPVVQNVSVKSASSATVPYTPEPHID